ncbi:hypothetical protein CAPTEDRAFT_193853 [Capitella teleta]|uniref:Uncharacterized protein n=1 Tax=Capitella teleta TaxID=283909 RepID=R7UYN7_CAPTE|nr:hypothetical protein CAPTEDRAFT_193853 [Capitella teleta]|eukprot:ELU11449.1 hypothetical protein CAPTEDRAFT_193853 [Capitella teleta]
MEPDHETRSSPSVDTPWVSLISQYSTPFKGYVETQEELSELLSTYSESTNAAFIKATGRSLDFTSVVHPEAYKVTWQNAWVPFSGQPFITAGRYSYECHRGKVRQCSKKQQKPREDHEYLKGGRFNLQPSKKVSCPARINLHKIIIFTREDFASEKLMFKIDEREVKKIKEVVAEGLVHAGDVRTLVDVHMSQMQQLPDAPCVHHLQRCHWTQD